MVWYEALQENSLRNFDLSYLNFISLPTCFKYFLIFLKQIYKPKKEQKIFKPPYSLSSGSYHAPKGMDPGFRLSDNNGDGIFFVQFILHDPKSCNVSWLQLTTAD